MKACFSLIIGISVLQAHGLSDEVVTVSEEETTYYENGAGYECGCDCCCEYEGPDLGHFQCRSTCDMPPHFAYPPMYHGYYYFRPYNYAHVLQHSEMITRLNGDPKAPYMATMFQSVYADGVYEEETGINRIPRPYANITSPLPNLQELLRD